MGAYEHTQSGTLMRVIFGWGAVACGAIAALLALHGPSSARVPVLIGSVLVVCLFLFHSLTVNVSRDCIMLRFGIGLIRKRFAVTDVRNAVIVRNRWYYGWGVRLTPHGWLYNVSGLDAVEIEFRNGRRYRIGTDEPAELLAAIKTVTTDLG